jgi:hypothetical protein
MFRCEAPSCGRWWHVHEIIATEDYDAGHRTPGPVIRSAPLDDHVENPGPVVSVDSACADCGQRGCVCRDPNDGEPTDFQEVDR